MENSQARGLIKGLETWAKKVTSGYRDVHVRDLSTSFRDGLAFCAIIHHYRPDLIDFESLSKENIFQNNSLAFSTAEKQLGVPALLDAEDMVKYAHPDRLSIITYLSQLHNCFVNQNKVKTLTPGIKIKQNSIAGPPPKVPAFETKLVALKRHEVCHVCGHRVFILERLIVDSKLYHTACFRCSKCKCLLNPGAYVESDTPGLYECAVCLPEENASSMETQDFESYDSSRDKYDSLEPTPARSLSPLIQNNVPSKSPLTESVTHARSNFLQNSLSVKSNEAKKDTPVKLRKTTLENIADDTRQYAKKDQAIESGVSVKDKINAFESNRNSKPESFFKSPELITGSKFKLSSIINSSNGDALHTDQTKSSTTVSVSSNNAEKSPYVQNNLLEKTSSKLKFTPTINTFSGETLTADTSKPCISMPASSPIDEKSSTVQNGDLIQNTAKTELTINTENGISLDAKMLSKPSDVDKQSIEIKEKLDGSNDHVQEDKQICDSSTSATVHEKVPTSTNFRHSLQFQTTEEIDSSKVSSIKQFQIGDYKSPLKTRDIFQTNIQPLKLSIPSVSSSKRESTVTSPDFVRPSTAAIPSIRPTYARTLPRQSSAGNLSLKEKIADSYSSFDGNLSDVLHSKWSKTTPRRSSLESQSQNSSVLNEKSHKTLQREESKSLTEVNVEASVNSFKYAAVENLNHSSGESKSKINEDSKSPFSHNLNYIPVPTVRRSLEIKKNLNFSETINSTKELGIQFEQTGPEKSALPERISGNHVEHKESLTDTNLASKSIAEKKELKPAPGKDAESEEMYPDDLNPFGDDMEEDEYPDDLNPFGDDEDTTPNASVTVTTEDYDESKNPFASDDEDIDVKSTPTKSISAKPVGVISPSSPFSSMNDSFSSVSSPTGSLRGTTKKRLAPKPPKLSDIFPTDSQDSEADVSLSSLKSSPAVDRRSLQTPSPKPRRNKPAAPPPPVPTNMASSQSDLAASTKQMKEADNLKLKSSSVATKDTPKMASKKRKRPAPPVPIPKRKDNVKIPLKEILREMREIEEKQRECERQGRELELLIRDKDKDEEPSVEEEEYIMQLFELVNQKNALFRRQAELMYIKRSQRLEEQQAEIQMQIRQLMEKPMEDKTEEDRLQEEMLILELKDIVDQRSSIIDSIEMDRRRELEEDASVQEQLEIKNGDLPITAEIKEKSSGKDKKSKKKEKKEKKKKDKKK